MGRDCFKGLVLASIVVAVAVGTQTPARAAPVGGYVALTRSGCDYFIVATKTGYAIFEWFSGALPDKDDFLVGSYSAFHTYGFHSIYDKTQDQGMRIYVEDYDLDEDDALDKFNEKCE